MSKAQPWKGDRLKSCLYSTTNLLDFIGLDYLAYRPNGMFTIDVGMPTDIQYLCTTGAWAFYREGTGKDKYPKHHEYESTLKRFYENVLSEHVAGLPAWKDVREAVKGDRV